MAEQGWKRARRVFLGTVKYTALATAALVALFVGINAFDEELSPQAKGLLIAPPNTVKPEENLYLALLGLQAPGRESPIAAGQARVAAYENDVAIALKDPRHAPQALTDPTGQEKLKLQFQGKADFCQPLTASCFAGVELHRSEIDHLLKANQELYRRYTRLRELKGYHETATPSLYVLLGYASRPVRQLYLANVALRIKVGTRSEQQEAIRDLLGDIRIWRIQLAGSESLISKFIAVANLHGDYALLADIIADPRFDLNSSSRTILSTLELPEDDWKTGRVFAYEFRFAAFLWEQMRVAGTDYDYRTGPDSDSETAQWAERLFGRLTFKINATQNLDAQSKIRLQQMGDAHPTKFFAARDAYRDWVRNNVDFGLHYVYNPTGKLLLNIASDAYEGYPLRAYDGAAFQRLVRVGYEIRARKIKDEAIPSFIEQNPQWASHPVDGRPFVWDPKKREIAVQTLGPQPKDRRFSISIWSEGRS